MEKFRKLKLPVIWRSYPNAGHEVTGDGMKLTLAFLDYHHQRTKSELGVKVDPMKKREVKELPLAPFVGDSQEWKYYPVGSEEAGTISPEQRMELPTEEIAKLWTMDDDTVHSTMAQDENDGN